MRFPAFWGGNLLFYILILQTQIVNNLRRFYPLAQSDYMKNNIATVHSLREFTKLTNIVLSLKHYCNCSQFTKLTSILTSLKHYCNCPQTQGIL